MSENLHEIRLCKISEKEKLKSFIDLHWKKGHILAHCDALLDFQHLDEKRGVYNFIVAFNKESKEFDAILGFIPTSQFDEGLKDNRDFWLAIWKVKPEFAKQALAMKLFYKISELYEPKSICAVGISQMVKPIYKFFKYEIDELKHFYIKNEHKKDFKIAHFTTNLNKNFNQNSKLEFKKLNEQDLLNLKPNFFLEQEPIKSPLYLINRYLKHKFYDYKAYAIYEAEKIKGVFIIREALALNSKCLRIIDFIGAFPKNAFSEFQKLLQEKNAEYIDLLCFVPNFKDILEMGFSLKDESEIIPNYFEPFEQKNAQITFAFKNDYTNFRIFKGDSDQDRPNFIKEKK